MKAVICHDDVKATVALFPVHAEKAHVVEVHSRKKQYAARLLRHEIVGMRRAIHGEAAIAQIESRAITITLKVGIETNEE